jgi:hypothetical protein
MVEEFEYDGEFSYKIPDVGKYLTGIIAYLRYKNETQISDLLKRCRCNISTSTQFSHKRWNAYYTVIHFYVPIEMLDSFTSSVQEKILNACDAVMPKSAGYDVMDIKFSPSLENIPVEQSLSEDLDQIVSVISQQIIPILPLDIKTKGKEMAEVYLYLYCIENSLRLFIENVAKAKVGDNWFEKLNLNRTIRDNIAQRKNSENQNAWLSIRGNSDLFFVDFKDLGSIISLNWELFKQYFPDLQWIDSKIAELAQCRNLVAHNSYIGDHEKEMIRLYYRSILKQIGVIH